MNQLLKNILISVTPSHKRENWAVSLLNSIGYGETLISKEVEFFLKSLNRNNNKSFVVLDIGANKGQYSAELLKQNTNVVVHAFEPSKIAAINFSINLNSWTLIKRCYIHNFGIGLKNKDAILYSNIPGSEQASLINNKGNNREKQKIKILNIENATKGISQIVGIKIDTEGNEFAVILSAEKLLKSKNFKSLQFEFGEYTIQNQESFKQYFEYLTSIGFKVFRLSKFGTHEILKYSPKLEIHWTTNYLATK